MRCHSLLLLSETQMSVSEIEFVWHVVLAGSSVQLLSSEHIYIQFDLIHPLAIVYHFHFFAFMQMSFHMLLLLVHFFPRPPPLAILRPAKKGTSIDHFIFISPLLTQISMIDIRDMNRGHLLYFWPLPRISPLLPFAYIQTQ